MNPTKTGAYIALKRKSSNLTQAELAAKLGITDKAVSKWERGKCLPDISLYEELCNILGITLNELIAGEDLMNNEKIAEQENKNIKELSALYQKMQHQYTLIIGLGLMIIGFIFNLLSRGASNSNFQDFINGLFLGMSIALMLVGVFVTVKAVAESIEENKKLK